MNECYSYRWLGWYNHALMVADGSVGRAVDDSLLLRLGEIAHTPGGSTALVRDFIKSFDFFFGEK